MRNRSTFRPVVSRGTFRGSSSRASVGLRAWKRPLLVQRPRNRAIRLWCGRLPRLVGICFVMSSGMKATGAAGGDGACGSGSRGKGLGEIGSLGKTNPAGICRWRSRPMTVDAARSSSSFCGSPPSVKKPNLVFELAIAGIQVTRLRKQRLCRGSRPAQLRVCVGRSNLSLG